MNKKYKCAVKLAKSNITKVAEAKATECVASVQRQAPDLIDAINADPQLKLNDEMLQRLGAALGLQ